MDNMNFSDFVKRDNKMINKKENKFNTVHKVQQSKLDEEYDEITESSIENNAMMMVENLKKKIDGVFYRFGTNGLEKLDNSIIEAIQELMNPSYISETKRVTKPQAPIRKVKKPIVKQEKIENIEREDTIDDVDNIASMILNNIPEPPKQVIGMDEPTSKKSRKTVSEMEEIHNEEVTLNDNLTEEQLAQIAGV